MFSRTGGAGKNVGGFVIGRFFGRNSDASGLSCIIYKY